MKKSKFILGVVALTASTFLSSAAFAQSVTFHSGVDFTTYGVQQAFTNTAGESENTTPEAGYDPDGNITVDVNVTAANFEFNLGLYFNADGGDEEYYDFSDQLYTPFYQGNMKVGFLNDQLQLYTGKWESFNAGYIEDGYVLGEQYITNLADSDYGQYLTGLEVAPYAVKGLKVFAGFPILPVFGNGIADVDYNAWSLMYKKAKLAAQYKLPIEALDITVNAGWRPGTYFDGLSTDDSDGAAASATYTTSAFGEGFLQVLLPGLLDLVDVNVSYDIRYRNASYTNISNKTIEHTAFAHIASVSGSMNLLDNALSLAVEDRFIFMGDDYLKSDEKLIYDVLAVNGEYALPGTHLSCGADLAGFFACDTNGTSFTAEGAIANDAYAADDDISLTINDMATAAVSNLSGSSTTYIGAYACPFFKVNFANGALKIGAEVAYTYYFQPSTDVANWAFSYRVPVGLTFAF